MSLRELAQHSGISASQLSKIESGKAKLTVDTALKLAGILKVPASIFLSESPQRPVARRSVTRKGQCIKHATPGMSMDVLCSDFKEKHQLFWKAKVTAKSFEENGGWHQHPGQEFLYVLSGTLALHSQYYDTLVLKAGDSILFDADQPHAYVSIDGPAEVLMMNSLSE